MRFSQNRNKTEDIIELGVMRYFGNEPIMVANINWHHSMVCKTLKWTAATEIYVVETCLDRVCKGRI